MRRLLGHRFRRTTLVAVFCAAVLGGIAVSRFTGFGISLVGLSLLLLVVGLRHLRLAALLAVVLAGVCIGGLRGTGYMEKLVQYEGIYNQKIVLVGQAVDDAGYGKQSQLSFDLTGARLDGTGRPLIGKIGVSGFGTNVIFRGDTVRVEGKLRSGLGSRQGYMSYANLSVISSRPGTIDTFRRKFAAGMQSALPEPEASFAMGLLIGQKATLPDNIYQDLVMVGLVHIIAVSGYNLTIILRACLKLLGKRSKYQTFVVAIALIAVFLLITGASASIVRASIVSGLSMAAWYYGRTFKPLVLILMTAAMTSLASPLYLWGDIGWYLSFLAFYGVLILSPQIHQRFLHGRIANSVLVGIATESLCAEIMTLPLVLYIFGQMSGISLAANVVVAALVPLAMLLSLVAGLAGMLILPIVGWFAWPAVIVLTYMLDAAHILASIPHIFRENVYLTAAGMLAMYAVVLATNILLHSRLKRNSAIITALPIAMRDENPLLRPSYQRSPAYASAEK
jgi:competence protein ComEC